MLFFYYLDPTIKVAALTVMDVLIANVDKTAEISECIGISKCQTLEPNNKVKAKNKTKMDAEEL